MPHIPTINVFLNINSSHPHSLKLMITMLCTIYYWTAKVINYIYSVNIHCKLYSTKHVNYCQVQNRTVTAVMKVLTITIIAWTCQLLAAQEKVCSTSCSTVGMLQSTPGKSCSDIYQINKVSRGASDNYWIKTTTGVHQVYCDMELECGGLKGGWMRIANLDTSMGDNCP